MKRKTVCIPAAVAVAVLLSMGPVRGQSSDIYFSLGAGVPELINAGLGVSVKQFQAGVTLGIFPYPKERILGAGLYMGYHFAGRSEHTEIKPWYASLGFNYLSDKTEDISDRYTYLALRLGREFNLSTKVALAIDGGVMAETSHSIVENEPQSGWDLDWYMPAVLPTGGFKFIFRFPGKE